VVRYPDVIEDVNKKIALLEKWYVAYRLAEHYDSYLDACYGIQARGFIQALGSWAEDFVSTKHIVYDLPCMPGLAEFLRMWNNFDLRGMYIYRATTTSYVNYYVESSTPFMVIDIRHMHENNLISFWSVRPYTSDYFVHKYVDDYGIDKKIVRVLVAPYDDAICSKDWYDNFSTEYTVIENDKPYNFGMMSYLRELEVCCFKYPSSRLVYALTYDDFMELMKYLPKKYVYSK